MRLLELCCGENHSWSRAGRALGYECTTLDWNPKCGADIIKDVRDYEAPEGYYDIVAASPDCRELSRARSMKGNAEFADEVCRACVRLCSQAKVLGVLENPLGALDRREWMKELEARKHVVDYCMYSGPRPDDFKVTTAGKQELREWFPYRKRTTLWLFGPNRWSPSRPLCNRGHHCEWLVDKRHICWAQHATEYKSECQRHCLPYSLSTAQLHRIPQKLCLEILGLARQEEGEREGE